MVKSTESFSCSYMKMSTISLLTFSTLILLVSMVSSAPESVTNLDQYATDSDSGVNSVSSLSPSSQHKSKITVYYPNMETQDILVEDLDDLTPVLDKKGAAWNKLQGGWGKRSDSWNKLSGGWGKRSGPGDRDWNQLSGMWGKRSSSGPGSVQSWNNLSGMWGKRGSQGLSLDGLPSSSASSRQSWNNLSGMWGKRGWNELNGPWGKRDSPHWNNLRGMWG
ncbi:prothoracicostatic peptides-like [Panonychus citri]|uniref:prothoracicostatic peptides-like n=1 Tax=Panonychus citri TaxID=50023 RepID=UPI0023073AEA|nr:prothoracicostatic peptides-like [Panonychus citri]